MKNKHISRRALLKGIAATSVVSALGYSSCAASAERVNPNGDLAKSVGYTEKGGKDGQHCGSCGLYRGGDAATGICPIFGDKEVSSDGWCTFWVISSNAFGHNNQSS